jgi:hypothetical protein
VDVGPLRARVLLPWLRSSVPLLATSLLALAPGIAAAAPALSIVWSATTGSGSPGMSTIEAQNGDILTAQLWLAADVEGIFCYSVSLEFDQDLDDELDLVSTTGFLPAGFDTNIGANPASSSESSGGAAGTVYSFDACCFLPPCGPVSTSFLIGEIEYDVVNVSSDGEDLFTGLFNAGIDGIGDSSGANISFSAIFSNATVDSAVPPATPSIVITDATNIALSSSQVELGDDTTSNPDVTGGLAGTLIEYTDSGSFTCCGASFLGDNLDDGDIGVGISSDGTYAIPDSGSLNLDLGSPVTIGSIAIYNGYTNRDDGTYTLRDGGANTLGAWTISTATGAGTNAGVDSFWLNFDPPVSTDSLEIDASSSDVGSTVSYREIQVFATQSKVPFAPRNTVVSGVADPQNITTADIDGDGDLDVLAAFNGGNRLAWYRNTDGAGTFALGQTLSAAADGARRLIPADLDGDGDLDLAATIQTDGEVVWFENTDGAGSFGTQTLISDLHDSPAGLAAADLDRDGDTDLLACSLSDNELAWYDNVGAGVFIRNQINNTTDRCASIAVADVDNDGDLDLITPQLDDSEVTWFENRLDEIANDFGPEQQIYAAASPIGVVAGDIDGDGDIDVVSGSQGGSMVAWYPNTNGTWGVQIPITTGDSSQRPSVGDVDGDGDLDVVCFKQFIDRFEWYENTAGDGSSWAPHLVTTDTDQPKSSGAADLDGDGDLDLISLSFSDNTIGWHENLTIHRSAAFPASSLIASAAAGAQRPESLDFADIDNDGDLDVLAASFIDAQISWYENVSGDGASWSDRRIATGPSIGATGVRGADVDGDGDIDVVSSADNGRIAWHENDGTPGGLGDWTQYDIQSTANEGKEVDVGDIDGDGDTDVVSAATMGNELAWYENDGTPTSVPWTERSIATGISGASWVELADIDRDGHLDAVYASTVGNSFGWVRNDGSSPPVWAAPHTIGSPVAGTAGSLRVVDVDGDGWLDVVAASQGVDVGQVIWFENDGTPGVGAWASHAISSSSFGYGIIDVFDGDSDGDFDVFAPASANRVVWFEHPDAVWFPAWAEHLVATGSGGQPFVVAGGDLDGDGDLDLVTGDVKLPSALDPDNRYAWFQNRGGQFALPTAGTGTTMLEGESDDVLSIEVDHNGRTVDTDLELASLALRLEDDLGVGLTNLEADALFSRVSLYADDGTTPDAYDVNDTELLFAAPPFSLAAGGGLTLVPADADPAFQLSPSASTTFFVVVTTQPDAGSQTPHLFEVLHITESSSTAEDRDHDLPLSLEFLANTGTGVIAALDPALDDDSDGLDNDEELDTHLTDPLDSDTDGDGVSDGDEVNTYLSDPLDTDSDDDGLDDGTEVSLGTSPTNPDHDGDNICDGPLTGGGACTAGPDNCPFIGNGGQENDDALEAGNACQCGDVTGDNVVTILDVTRMQENLVNAALSGPFDATRCNVIGPSDGGISDCDVADIFILQRFVAGNPVTVQNACIAYSGS